MEEPNVTSDGIEKVDNYSSESQTETETETNVTTMEYPTKLKLVMIVVALVLSMFLVSEALNSSPYCSHYC